MDLFKELSAVDVNQYKEQKGRFTYLSWAFAVQELLKRVPDATWEMLEPTTFDDGSMMVWCKLTCKGITRTAYLPVTDHRNQPIKKPNCFDINTAMQRCLAKAIALQGLGLYIYAGEDLPTVEQVTDYETAKQKLQQDDALAFREWLEEIGEERLNNTFNDAPNGEKVSWKKQINAEIKRSDAKLHEYESQLTGVLARRDAVGFAQLWDEMSRYAKEKINLRISDEQKRTAKELQAELGAITEPQ